MVIYWQTGTSLLRVHLIHVSKSPQDYHHGHSYHRTTNLLWRSRRDWVRIAVVSSTTAVLKVVRPPSLRRRTRWSVFSCDITGLSLGPTSLVEDSFLDVTSTAREFSCDAIRGPWWTCLCGSFGVTVNQWNFTCASTTTQGINWKKVIVNLLADTLPYFWHFTCICYIFIKTRLSANPDNI